MIHLILASASIGRKHILSQLKIPFDILPTDIDEENIVGKTPLETIQLRARRKSEAAINKLSFPRKRESKPFNVWIPHQVRDDVSLLLLTADTEVVLNNNLIGKPKDYNDAVRIFQTLSGRTHEVITALCLRVTRGWAPNKRARSFARATSEHLIGLSERPASTQRGEQDPQKISIREDYDRSLVTFRKLTLTDIKRYLSLTDYKRFTGGYALITSPQDFITKIDGSISNVIGLPLEKLIPILEEHK